MNVFLTTRTVSEGYKMLYRSVACLMSTQTTNRQLNHNTMLYTCHIGNGCRNPKKKRDQPRRKIEIYTYWTIINKYKIVANIILDLDLDFTCIRVDRERRRQAFYAVRLHNKWMGCK